MGNEFESKVVVITGGSQGIGLAAVEEFAKKGAKVVILDILVDEGTAAAEKFDGMFIKTDLAKEDEIKKAVDLIIETYGRIDILINNAGVNIPGDILEVPKDKWDLTMNVNVNGYYLMSREVIPHMKKQGKGIIVNTASGNSFMAENRLASYVTSKGAVLMLTKSMAVDFIKDNIRVNCVCPGWVDTSFNDDHADLVGGGREKVLESIDTIQPIGRPIHPSEIAKTILFLASDDSSCLVGSAIIADGGLMAGF